MQQAKCIKHYLSAVVGCLNVYHVSNAVRFSKQEVTQMIIYRICIFMLYYSAYTSGWSDRLSRYNMFLNHLFR